MEPIRILHELAMMDTGGVETQLMRIYRHIDRSKVQFDFLLHRSQKSAYDDEICAMGGRIFRVARFNPMYYMRYMNGMRRFFAEHAEYRIVVVHSDLALGPLKAAWEAGVPWRICYSHNGRSVWNVKRCFMDYERLFLKRYCSEMFAVSEVAARYMFGDRAVDAGKVRLIRNGITVGDFVFREAKREEKRRELGLEGRFIVGHVGRFEQQKNHEFLLDVFQHLRGLRPNAHLILIGKGRLEKKIRARIDRLGLRDAVTLLDSRMDIHDMLKAMDVMILPSLWEGFPNVAIEAQACALPTYMSQNVTAEADFSPYACRLSLGLGARAWAERIHGDMKEPVARVDMSAAMREKGFDVQTIAKCYEAFYIRKMNELLCMENKSAGE